MLNRRAFTLIELLVTVAIVAVMSAILFPVFMGAREAARQTVCASNYRQAGFASTLYLGDNNDGFLPAAYNASLSANSTNDRRWPQLLRAYLPESLVFKCPSDPTPWPRPPATFDPDLVTGNAAAYDYQIAKLSNLGYNYLYLAPIVNLSGRRTSMPRSIGMVTRPEETVFGVDSAFDVDQTGRPFGGGSHLVVPPCRFQQNGTAQVDTFFFGQGIEVVVADLAWSKDGSQNLREYGGAWPWHRGRMTVLFVDGRAKPLSPTQLARGCNVENAFQGVIVDPNNYNWDLQ